MSQTERKISFPVDSVLSAIIQDGDIQELWTILTHQRGEFDINQENHVGLTALHHAVLSNNLDAVKMLLAEGSDINAQDVHGFSPLHTAAACGFIHISSLLIVFGADVFLQTKQAEMPIDVAKDLATCRLLADEMYPIIHREIYWSSILTSKLWHLWEIIWKFLLLIYNSLFRVPRSGAQVDECNNSTVVIRKKGRTGNQYTCRKGRKTIKLN